MCLNVGPKTDLAFKVGKRADGDFGGNFCDFFRCDFDFLSRFVRFLPIFFLRFFQEFSDFFIQWILVLFPLENCASKNVPEFPENF